MDNNGMEDNLLFWCTLCGMAQGDSSNLSSQQQLQTNATVNFESPI
jgi:hypothetical protein